MERHTACRGGLACREPAGSLLAACVFAIVDGRLRPGQHFTSDSSLYCPAFAVAPAHRRSGLGRATCAQLLSLANAAQVTRALVTAAEQRREAEARRDQELLAREAPTLHRGQTA